MTDEMNILVIPGKEDKNGMNEGMENNYTKKAIMTSAPILIICIKEYIVIPTPALQQITNHVTLHCPSAQENIQRRIHPKTDRSLYAFGVILTLHCKITGPAGHRIAQKMARTPETG
jgi:hypothetical protein